MAKASILIADDDREVARLLSSHLKGKGFDVAFAYDSMQTIMAVRRAPPDVLVLDIKMPGGSGVDVLQKLKASAKTHLIPVIVISASTDPRLPQKVKDLGAEEFFLKPFELEQLDRALYRLLGKPLDTPVEELPPDRWAKLQLGRTSGKERRKNLRIRTRAWVWVEYGGNQLVLGNLSMTGAFIRTESPPQVGTALELRLVGERLLEPIGLKAIVRRSTHGSGMGVQFTRFHGPAQASLEELLTNLSVPRILVVDDDENTRRLVKLTFKREPYEVLEAADGVEGLQMALSRYPDLLILDIAMPGLSGLEVCQRVRATPHLAQVPIVMLSATTDLADFRSAQQLGAVGFIHKPFHPDKLLNHIRMLLKS